MAYPRECGDKSSNQVERKMGSCFQPDTPINPFSSLEWGGEVMEENIYALSESDLDSNNETCKPNEPLDLPVDSYSLNEINVNLPTCIQFGFRSGTTHFNMPKFCVMSRGQQGTATAIAAYATSSILKPECWNADIIDQIIEDGDAYFLDSFKSMDLSDRKSVTIENLKRILAIQRSHIAYFQIEEAIYVGTFRSQSPTEMHLAQALQLFFETREAAILTSTVLNVSIWKDKEYFVIFDGQPRKCNCDVAIGAEEVMGTAKVILVPDMMGVLFVILTKSNVENEFFVLHAIEVLGTEEISKEVQLNLIEREKYVQRLDRKSSGYKIQMERRAFVRASYHLNHPSIPQEYHGKNHLVLAVAMLIYSKIVKGYRWNSALLDIIFNHAHLYFVDLLKTLEREIEDAEFQLTLQDIPQKMEISVYTASVEFEEPNVPKGMTAENALREFFAKKTSCLLEIKGVFYAVWKENDKYYFFDPFACDESGFRVEETPETVDKLKTATASLSMNSSIYEIAEVIVKNSGIKDKDPITIHGARIVWIKTNTDGSSSYDFVFQEENVNCYLELYAPSLKTKLKETINQVIARCNVPTVVPLGPAIKTPIFKRKYGLCVKEKKCKICPKDKNDPVLVNVICYPRKVLFNTLFCTCRRKIKCDTDSNKTDKASNVRPMVECAEKNAKSEGNEGFVKIDDYLSIIRGTVALDNRSETDDTHHKACFYSAMLSILGKIRLNSIEFCPQFIDQFVQFGDEIYQSTKKLRYREQRQFNNIHVFGGTFSVVLTQVAYADPENFDNDDFCLVIKDYLNSRKSGILVTNNSSYAFWELDRWHYLLDAYSCDEQGRASEKGSACLLRVCGFDKLIEVIESKCGEGAKNKPYRLYSLEVSHMEVQRARRKRKKCVAKLADKRPREECRQLGLEKIASETSLIELPEWVAGEALHGRPVECEFDRALHGYVALRSYNACVMEITELDERQRDICKCEGSCESMTTLDREVMKKSQIKLPIAPVLQLFDLAVMAWSRVYNPLVWTEETVKLLFDVAETFVRCALPEDGSPPTEIHVDGNSFKELDIANYRFRVMFATLHHGKLYATRGWNLAMSLQKIFDNPVYTAATLRCENKKIGIMKIDKLYYAWWYLRASKSIKIVVSEDFDDYLKILIQHVNKTENVIFTLRINTISYAQKFNCNADDESGLYDSLLTRMSLAQVHRSVDDCYNLEDIFRPTIVKCKPVFVLGSVALREWDLICEPRVKRCYFAAILAVLLKRDIMQSPMPGMANKIIESAETLYLLFKDCEYHSEHILRNFCVQGQTFEIYDCSYDMVDLQENSITITPKCMFLRLRKHLSAHLKRHSSGMLQLSNVCYGFWYSQENNRYYYFDPYGCDAQGLRDESGGASCLCVFKSLCEMVQLLCINMFKHATGFYVHCLHVMSLEIPRLSVMPFIEDRTWLYLDYVWRYSHRACAIRREDKCRVYALESNEPKEMPRCYSYTIEVPNLIYSLWGTISCYDARFGETCGKNQAAVCTVLLGLQYTSHPSQWTPATLDTAVICGNIYYKESLKSTPVRPACRPEQPIKYKLKPCFKIAQNVWNIRFLDDICGVLFGGRCKLSLAQALSVALKDSSSVVLECFNVNLAILWNQGGFYVGDPHWIGVPLFAPNRGALYLIYCHNFEVLVFAVIKMLNTNENLPITVTPVEFTFCTEICKQDKTVKMAKRILTEPVNGVPGKCIKPLYPIPGAIGTPETYSYIMYKRKLYFALVQRDEYDDISLYQEDTESVVWLKRALCQSDDSLKDTYRCKRKYVQRTDSDCRASNYPKVIDFLKDVPKEDNNFCCSPTVRRPVKTQCTETNSFDIYKKPKKPLSFILDRSRTEFHRSNKDLKRKYYKEIEHRRRVSRSDAQLDETAGTETAGAESQQPTTNLTRRTTPVSAYGEEVADDNEEQRLSSTRVTEQDDVQN